MTEEINVPQPPRGLSRILWRLPIILYRARLGWLLGNHFLLLTHTGRISGKARQAVIEIIRYDETGEYYLIASGFGEKSDWFKNIQKTPKVMIQVGRRKTEAFAEQLPPIDAENEMLDYARRHPNAIKNLARILGYNLDGTDESYRALSRVVPIVALRPHNM
jgi:deazaflavin-dependent oxidoreductase (nitroreductase family)